MIDQESAHLNPEDPNLDEFILAEFYALRTEILDLRKRVVQLLSLGITGIPLLVGAGQSLNSELIICAGPLVTVVFTLMLLYEQNSIMRAGRYIRLVIEPRLHSNKECGWEKYLEQFPRNRLAERLFAFAAHGTFAVYYLGGTYFAHQTIKAAVSADAATWIAAAYIGLFCTSFYTVIRNFPIGTKSSNEKFI